MKRTLKAIGFVLLAVGLLAVGCVPSPTPEPQNPAEIALTMAGQKMDAEATQMRINIIYTATAQVVEVTRSYESTQVAAGVTEQARQDAAATDAQGRQDGAATEQSRRRDAAATEQRIRDDEATQQARRDIEATAEQSRQNVVGTATAQMAAIWNAATLAVAPTHDYMTLQAAYAEQTRTAYESELKGLDVEQQSQKNTAEWVVPLLLVLIVVVVFAVVQIRRSRVQKIENADDGTVEAVIVDSNRAFRPQLMTKPLMLLEVDGEDVVDPGEQSEVTRRAQGVLALKALPASVPPQMYASLYNNVFGNASQEKPRIEIVDAEVVKEWVEDVTRQADDKEAQ